MRCFYCNKNEATKSYESIKNGEKKREYYCQTCYEQLFLCNKTAEGVDAVSACPYCGTSVEEFHSTSIVGCPYCYQTLAGHLLSAIIKMQGDASGHRGKTLPLSLEGEAEFEQASYGSIAERVEIRDALIQKERFARQKNEMEMLIDFLNNQKDRQAEYKNKLERMEQSGEIEEEIVW